MNLSELTGREVSVLPHGWLRVGGSAVRLSQVAGVEKQRLGVALKSGSPYEVLFVRAGEGCDPQRLFEVVLDLVVGAEKENDRMPVCNEHEATQLELLRKIRGTENAHEAKDWADAYQLICCHQDVVLNPGVFAEPSDCCSAKPDPVALAVHDTVEYLFGACTLETKARAADRLHQLLHAVEQLRTQNA